MYWIEAHADAIEYFTTKKANKVKEVNGIEIWRDAYNYFRLIRRNEGKILISSHDFLAYEYAEEAAEELK